MKVQGAGSTPSNSGSVVSGSTQNDEWLASRQGSGTFNAPSSSTTSSAPLLARGASFSSPAALGPTQAALAREALNTATPMLDVLQKVAAGQIQIAAGGRDHDMIKDAVAILPGLLSQLLVLAPTAGGAPATAGSGGGAYFSPANGKPTFVSASSTTGSYAAASPARDQQDDWLSRRKQQEEQERQRMQAEEDARRQREAEEDARRWQEQQERQQREQQQSNGGDWREASEDWISARNRAQSSSLIAESPFKQSEPAAIPAPASPSRANALMSSAVAAFGAAAEPEQPSQSQIDAEAAAMAAGMDWRTALKTKKQREEIASRKAEEVCIAVLAICFFSPASKCLAQSFLLNMVFCPPPPLQDARAREEAKWAGVPAWKRKLLEEKEQKRIEAEAPMREAQRLEEERQAHFNSLPAWKQKLLLEKQK